MKTSKNDKLILSAIAFFLTAACVYAYPPDNAAVLYYKAATHYQNRVDDEMTDALADLSKGKIDLNDKIIEYIKKNQYTIDTVLDASEVKNCDWGLNISQGLDEMMPHLSKMRDLSRLVIADVKILTEDGDYQQALSHCMSLYNMARHTNDRIFISHLVSIAMNEMTNVCVIQIISDMPQNMQNLAKLKSQIIEIDSVPFSIKPAIWGERKAILMFMTPEHIPSVVQLVEDKVIKEKLLAADKAFLERNREYFKDYYAGVIAAFDMPYADGYTTLSDIMGKPEKDVKSNPDATLTAVLAPAMSKMFSHETRLETHNNAIKTALELYLIKAKTGKLPEELPAGVPGDMFSGKPFEYEKTSDGFILRCQGKDLGRDKLYEYEFKVGN